MSNSKEKAKAIACIIVVLLPSLTTLVFADAPSIPGALYLEINGAKVVSEGGFFLFSIKNKGDYWIEVALHYPPEFNIFRLNTSKTVCNVSEVFGDGVYSFPLEPNDTWAIGFVAPTLPSDLSYKYYMFTFYSAYGGISTDKAIDASYYSLLVVKGVNSVKVDDSLKQLLSLYNELLTQYNELSSKLNQLLLLYNDSSSKLEALRNADLVYVLGFLLSLVFVLLIMWCIEIKRIERTLKRRKNNGQ
jgi:hypothetical protein